MLMPIMGACMKLGVLPITVSTVSMVLLAAPAAAQKVPNDGYLCCNLQVNGAWASDANAARSGSRLLRPGTKVIGLAYGSAQVDVEAEGQKISIGNDDSRSVPMETFAARWIVPKNPQAAMSKWTPRIQQSIKAGRITMGMNRKQVLMSLGWPTASSTPNLEDPVWNYTASNGSRYKVVFNSAWLVKAVDGDAQTKQAVLLPSK